MVAGNKVHAFPVMEDGVVRVDGSIHNNSVHEGSEREMNVIQIMLAEADGQAALRICVYEQNFLLSTGKTDAEVQSSCRLSDAALLVDYGNDFCVFHVVLFSFRLFALNEGSFSEGCTDDPETVLLICHAYYSFSTPIRYGKQSDACQRSGSWESHPGWVPPAAP